MPGGSNRGQDGGRIAARGFTYQCLRTVEAVLIALADPRFHTCRVEGDPYPTELSAVGIVDFDLIDTEGNVLQSVQVKSGGTTARTEIGPVFQILFRLTGRGEAEQYALVTDAQVSASVRELQRVLSLPLSPGERRARLERVSSAPGHTLCSTGWTRSSWSGWGAVRSGRASGAGQSSMPSWGRLFTRPAAGPGFPSGTSPAACCCPVSRPRSRAGRETRSQLSGRRGSCARNPQSRGSASWPTGSECPLTAARRRYEVLVQAHPGGAPDR